MPNRYFCDTADELIKIIKGVCYEERVPYLISLVEELRSMAGRMESALADRGDYNDMLYSAKKTRNQIEKLLQEDNFEEAFDALKEFSTKRYY